MENKKAHSLNRIIHAHDAFFKMAMADKRVAKEFFEAHLPKDFLPFIDFDKLKLASESYIDDFRQTSVADMLFKTEMYGTDAYLYLVVDHQSRPDKMMPFRMLKYTCNIIDQHLKETGTQYIPFVIPFVLYHGEQPWNHSTDIRDLVDAPKVLVEDYFLKPFILVDLNKIDDTTIKQRVWLGVMELTLKHIFDKNMQLAFKDIIELLKVILVLGEQQFTEATLSYILDRGQLENKAKFIEEIKLALSEEMEGRMATIAEQYWAEGKQEGKQEGIEEVAKRLLSKHERLEFIAEITGLSLGRIQEIKEQCLKPYK